MNKTIEAEITTINWSPMGQRVLQTGYKQITKKEMAIELGVSLSAAKDCNEEIEFYYNGHKCDSTRINDLWTLHFIDVKQYLRHIHKDALALIEKAHTFGINTMYVLTAEKRESLPDPIVAAYWNDSWWFITRWE